MSEALGIAEAKRRFSELIDRVAAGERIMLARRGRPAAALVPPGDELVRAPGGGAPTGFAALAGVLAELDDLDDVMRDVYASRQTAKDRLAPVLD
jgi:prevent-host-death family protein